MKALFVLHQPNEGQFTVATLFFLSFINSMRDSSRILAARFVFHQSDEEPFTIPAVFLQLRAA
ncbi:hypothetical protein B4099_2822 [Heyndrickxia coagulans]|uniref:Uncharacterized protein n=1 Tax=Heyndrickxia coagulans TaxID=1398 RepID=A0A150KJG8_HEYCO|nr:hypothetical protein B4099_2822 [Heyndrickxia coagulans]